MFFTILLVIIFLSILVLVHELGHFIAARSFGLLIEEFGIGLPPRVRGKKIGETIWSFNALPFGGFVKIFGEGDEEKNMISDPKLMNRSYANIAPWKKAVILFSGVFMNFLFGWLMMSSVLMAGTPSAVIVGEVMKGSPAEIAGLVAGDRIVNVFLEGRSQGNLSATKMITIQEVADFAKEHGGEEIVLVARDSRGEKNIRLIPRSDPPPGEGSMGALLIDGGIEKRNFFEALGLGMKISIGVVKEIFIAIFDLILKAFTLGAGTLRFLTGPVGIVNIAGEAQEIGFAYFVQLFALVSLNLAVFNILPFPALDGGHLLFLVLEKIKGSPLSTNFKRSLNALGMSFLLLLILMVSIKDIFALF